MNGPPPRSTATTSTAAAAAAPSSAGGGPARGGPDQRIRLLGLGSAIALIVANMVGTGVFTTSGYALADLGNRGAVLAAWVLGGVLALLGALSYGALARRFPHSGGEYHFLRVTLHPLAGFLAGWVSLLAGFTAPLAVNAHALRAYATPLLGDGPLTAWIGAMALVAAGALHMRGVRPGARAQNAIVAAKVLLMLAMLAIGAAVLPGRPAPAPPPEATLTMPAFAVTLVWVSFAYSGWNAVVYVGGEVQRPERNLPLAMIAATAAVTALYVGLNAVFLWSADASALMGQKDVAAIAAAALGGEPLRLVVSAIVSLALLTSISAMVMAGPRVYARMAEDGLFPRALVPAGEGAPPRAAIALQVLLALVLLASARFDQLLEYVGWTLWLSAVATVLGLVVVRLREGAAAVPVPGWPLVPLVFCATGLGVTVFSIARAELASMLGLATVLAGVPLYWLMRATASPPA